MGQATFWPKLMKLKATTALRQTVINRNWPRPVQQWVESENTIQNMLN